MFQLSESGRVVHCGRVAPRVVETGEKNAFEQPSHKFTGSNEGEQAIVCELNPCRLESNPSGMLVDFLKNSSVEVPR